MVLQRASGCEAPLWIREGFARYAAQRTSSEWMPVETPGLIASLRVGVSLPLRSLEVEFIGERNPLCRAYAAAVFEEWAQRYGSERLLVLLRRLRAGEEWTAALETVFGTPLETIDAQTRAGSLKRYAHLAMPQSRRVSAEVLLDSGVQSDDARIERAALFLDLKRYDDALRALAPLLEREAPPTRAMLIAGRAAHGSGEFAKARDRILLGLELEKVRAERIATSRDYETLGLARLELEEPDEAAAAFRRAIEKAPFDSREHGAYGRLLELLGKEEPKPAEYYEVLEKRLRARRTDARGRVELAQWLEGNGDLERAFQHYKSAAGIRPEWIAAHRALAPLARQLGKLEDAYASYRVLHAKRPEDVRVLRSLAECARALGRQGEAEKYERLLKKDDAR